MMQINPSGNARPAERTTGRSPVPAKTAAPSSPVELRQTESLNNLLAQAADVRPEQVERARRLVNDKHYPPEVVVRGVARLLASKLDGHRENNGEKE